jgi:hypothetical protein
MDSRFHLFSSSYADQLSARRAFADCSRRATKHIGSGFNLESVARPAMKARRPADAFNDEWMLQHTTS